MGPGSIASDGTPTAAAVAAAGGIFIQKPKATEIDVSVGLGDFRLVNIQHFTLYSPIHDLRSAILRVGDRPIDEAGIPLRMVPSFRDDFRRIQELFDSVEAYQRTKEAYSKCRSTPGGPATK
jgi:hypothetical protein